MYGKHDTSSDAYKLIKKALDIRNYEKVYDQDLNEVYADDNLYSYSRGNKILVVVTNTDKTIEKDFTEHQFKEGTKCFMVKLPSFTNVNLFNEALLDIEAWFEKNK